MFLKTNNFFTLCRIVVGDEEKFTGKIISL